MEMTASLFEHLCDDLDERQRTVIRTAFCDGSTGLVPGCEYRAEGGFVERTYELTGFRCTALLPSGRLMSVDEDLKLPIPRLSGSDYYLCVGESAEGEHLFEKDGIPYRRPRYELSLHTPEELPGTGLFAIKHFLISDGTLQVEEGFIPAALSLSSDGRLMEHVRKITGGLKALAEHPNMEEGECRRTLRYLVFRLGTITGESPVRDLVCLLQETVQACGYHIADVIGSTLENIPEEVLRLREDGRREPRRYDIAAFLRWTGEYIEALGGLMDRVVPVDRTIDYEKLKREIREEIYSRLREEITADVTGALHGRLTEELTGSLTEMLRGMFSETVPALREELADSLHSRLYPELYDAVYEALKALLYKPEESKEESFLPLI